MLARIIAILAVVTFEVAALTTDSTPHLQPALIHYRAEQTLDDSFVREFAIWNAAVGGYFTLVKAEPGGPCEVDVMLAAPGTLVGPNTIGQYDGLHIKILSPMSPGIDVDTVMLHEIGHFLGLSHSKELASIMYATIWEGKPPELSNDDLLRIQTLYVPTEMSPLKIDVKGAGKTKTLSTTMKVDWDFGDGAVASGIKVRHHFSAPGTYTVTAKSPNAPSLSNPVYRGTITITIESRKRRTWL